MKLHKRLTTVTDFSKAVAGVLFIGIPIITFFIGYQYGAEAEQATELYRQSAKIQPVKDNDAGMMGGKTMPASPNRIMVSEQKPGRQVSIAEVAVEKPAFVAIHRVDANGKAGAVIGQSTLITSTAQNVVITLKEMVAAGDTLIAMVHTDDGDSTFEFPGADAPLMDSTGAPVQMQFSVTPQAMNQGVEAM